MAKPASKILGDAEFLVEKVKPNITDLANKTLLPTDHVQMWLEHVDEVHKNRMEGAK